MRQKMIDKALRLVRLSAWGRMSSWASLGVMLSFGCSATDGGGETDSGYNSAGTTSSCSPDDPGCVHNGSTGSGGALTDDGGTPSGTGGIETEGVYIGRPLDPWPDCGANTPSDLTPPPTPAVEIPTTVIDRHSKNEVQWQTVDCDEQQFRDAVQANDGAEKLGIGRYVDRKVRFNHGGGCTIKLNSPILIGQDSKVIIDGEGKVTLDGQNKSQLIKGSNNPTIVLKGLTFRNGRADTPSDASKGRRGGAVLSGSGSTLYVDSCNFYDNKSVDCGDTHSKGGGALYAEWQSDVTVVNSHFENNSGCIAGAMYNMVSRLAMFDTSFVNNTATRSFGGGLYVDGARDDPNSNNADAKDSIHIERVSFFKNKGKGQGGGLYLYGYHYEKATVKDCAFVGNYVSKDHEGKSLGGGMRWDTEQPTAELYLLRSTFDGNTADAGIGGGLSADERSRSYAQNCTLVNNTTLNGGSGAAIGGSLDLLLNSTLANNHADGQAGSVYRIGKTDDFPVVNSLFVNNTSSQRPESPCDTSLNDEGGNFEYPQTSTPCLASASREDPQLEALADNRGATRTMALPASSPAVNHNSDRSRAPSRDQRGYCRDNNPDSGAFELQ